MECYTHAGQSSVALCKVCHKGLCRDCGRFMGKSVVCSEACGEQADLQAQVFAWGSRYVVNKGAPSLMARQYRYIALIFVVLGCTLFLPMVYDYIAYGHKIPFAMFSFVFSLFVVALLTYRSMPK